MSIAFLLLLTLGQSIDSLQQVNVDRVEINTVYECGEIRFTQLILWRWSPQLRCFLVAEWHIVPNGYTRQANVIRWSDAGFIARSVRAKSVIVTRGIDTEVEARKRFPTCERTPYFAEK